jgi:hypothetical protein
MKTAIVCSCFFLSVLNAQQALTNDTLVKLTQAGIGEDIIVSMVSQQPGKYSVADSDIATLKSSGVSQKVIAALIVRSSSGRSPVVGGAITLYDANGTPVQIAVAPNAGNPAPIVLPTKTGPIGGVLMTNGQTPQRTVWATLGNALMVAGNTLTLNTAVVLTDANASAGKPWYCKSSPSSATNLYACSLNSAAAPTAYTEGMFLLLNPGASNLGSSTLNVDGVGLVPILQKDGISQVAAGQLTAGQAVWIWYDGRSFRLMY